MHGHTKLNACIKLNFIPEDKISKVVEGTCRSRDDKSDKPETPDITTHTMIGQVLSNTAPTADHS